MQGGGGCKSALQVKGEEREPIFYPFIQMSFLLTTSHPGNCVCVWLGHITGAV